MNAENWIALAGVSLTFGLGLYNLGVNSALKRKTHFVDTITGERIKWLEKLRVDISRFSGLTSFWVKSLKGTNDEYSKEALKEIDILRVMIKLRINPKEEEGQEIITLIDEIPKLTDNTNIIELDEKLNQLTLKSQDLLKEEWEKVKRETNEGKENKTLDKESYRNSVY